MTSIRLPCHDASGATPEMLTPKDPVPIQLCVQGGAAKIALLTAFMEAVEELHNDHQIFVTNIAEQLDKKCPKLLFIPKRYEGASQMIGWLL